jgi:hypothetical protein
MATAVGAAGGTAGTSGVPQVPPAGTKDVMTDAGIASVAVSAGFAAASIPIVVAIALAESGGDCWSVSPSDDFGLMQINFDAHKDLFAAHPNGLAWALPQTNMADAYSVFNAAGSFKPWTSYLTGTYAAFLARGQKAAAAPSSADAAAATERMVGQIAVMGVTSAAATPAAGSAVLIRLLEVVIGGVMLLMGLQRLAKPVSAPIVNAVSSGTKKAAAVAAMA